MRTCSLPLLPSFTQQLKLQYIDAQHRPTGGAAGDAAGVGNATSGSLTDRLTREHRMTMDEAHLILNTKRAESFENVLKVRLSHFIPRSLR